MRVKTDAKRQEILEAAAGGASRARLFRIASMAAVSKADRRFKGDALQLLFLQGGPVPDDPARRGPRRGDSKLFDMLRPAHDLRVVLERFGVRFLELSLSSGGAGEVRRILIAEGSRSGLGQRLFERGAEDQLVEDGGLSCVDRSQVGAAARRGSMDDGDAPARLARGRH